jgi:hypothetical protein
LLIQLEEIEELPDAGPRLVLVDAVKRPDHEQEFEAGEGFIDRARVWHETEQPLGLHGVGDDVHAADQGRALVRLEHAGDHFQRGGLASAVGPQKTHNHARRDFQREVIDGGLSAEALREPWMEIMGPDHPPEPVQRKKWL